MKNNMFEGGDYSSEFDECDTEDERKRNVRRDLVGRPKVQKERKANSSYLTEEVDKADRQVQRYHFLSLDAYSRHKQLINEYFLYHKGATSLLERDRSRDKTDLDVVRENHKFLWDDSEEPQTWGQKLAKNYFGKLFKEYCITDLSRYKENKIALRWRIEKEVVSGKGQFTCGNKTCESQDELRSWEVNFAYVEDNAKKNALVKLRLCPPCSERLNYRHKRREVKRKRKLENNRNMAMPAKLHKKDEGETSGKSNNETTTRGSDTAEKAVNIWEQPVKADDETNKEDEFQEYLEDLFL